jgi:hypothetical protein
MEHGPGYGPGYGPVLMMCPACGGPVVATAVSCPHCGYRPAPAAASARSSAGSTGLAVGAFLIVVGSFLPWATFSGFISMSVNGVDGGRDGVLTLAIGVLLGGLAIASVQGPGFETWLRVLATLGGLAAAAVAIYDGSDIANLGGDFGDYFSISVDIGIGIYAIVLGGVVSIAAALFAGRR